MKPNLIWARADADTPFVSWWKDLQTEFQISDKLNVEKWLGSDLSWPEVLDSLRSFSLFGKGKVLVVLESEKAFKKEKNSDDIIAQLKKGPHTVILHSTEDAPKSFPGKVWRSSQQEEPSDDKAVFRWIDAIQNSNLKISVIELERVFESELHSLASLQLLTRHFRMGRLIQHATQKGLGEAEIQKVLKIPGFVVQKWKRHPRISQGLWLKIFERLQACDLELKSGSDDVWALRKLSFDLCEYLNRKRRPNLRMPSQPLWQAAPSFF